MPINKNALLRYKIIDYLFGQIGALYSLDQLLNSLNDRLENQSGPTAKISMRTLKNDISTMRRPFPEGFNAPIVNHWGTGLYEYSDKRFSIYNLRLSKKDKTRLKDALSILSQLDGLPHFEYLEDIMTRLRLFEDSEAHGRKVVFFEDSYNTKGLNWLKPLHQAIIDQKSLKIDYSPFSGPPDTFIVFPYFLKEYRNRWYLFGWNTSQQAIHNLALDRMNNVVVSIKKFEDHRDKIPKDKLNSIVGVTIPTTNKREVIKLKIYSPSLPYIITKPLHHSQKIISSLKNSAILQYYLIPNFEFEAEIMRLSQSIEVLEPLSLRKSIVRKLKMAGKHYKV